MGKALRFKLVKAAHFRLANGKMVMFGETWYVLMKEDWKGALKNKNQALQIFTLDLLILSICKAYDLLKLLMRQIKLPIKK